MARSSAFAFRLPQSSRLKLRDQVCEAVTLAISQAQIAPGMALPSCRELADQLQVSRNTVFAAYTLLVDQGIVDARDRSGYYIAPSALTLVRPDAAQDCRGGAGGSPLPQLRNRPSSLRRVEHPADWAGYPYPFVFNQPDPKYFPVEAWRECSRKAMNRKTIADWTQDSVQDDSPHLVREIRQRLLTYRGITAHEDEVMITLGAQNGLAILATLFRHAEGAIAMEDPGFPDARNAFLTAGNHVVPVPVDAEGLVAEAVPEGCSLVYTTPSHQFPTSVSMSGDRRAALLAAAERRNFMIVEDDYEAELHSGRRPEATLRALDETGRVIYVGSLSKTLAPGLRIGFVVAHRDVIHEARAVRRTMLRHTPTLVQETLAYFLQMGFYDAHLRKMMRHKRERWLCMEAAIAAQLPSFAVQSSGGTSFWLTGHDGFDSSDFARRLLSRGVIVDDGAPFYMNEGISRSFRMGFAMVGTRQIEAGMREIADEFAQQRV